MKTEFLPTIAWTSSLSHGLFCATLATSTAIVFLLIIRKPMRQHLGATAAYLMWVLVPIAALVVLIPPPVRSLSPRFLQVMEIAVVATAVGVPPLSTRTMDVDAGTLLVIAWTLGTLLSLAQLTYQQRRFVRSLGQLCAVDRSTVRAQTTEGCPALVGVWRPLIVLPADFESRYEPDERELILAHERCHRVRGDAHFNLLAAILRCVFWFNPLVHIAASLFRFDQELACDAAVISLFPWARRSYANAMLKTQLADFGLPAGCHWQSLRSSRSNRSLGERIMMLKKSVPSRAHALLGIATAIALVAAGSVAAWAAQPAQTLDGTPGASMQSGDHGPRITWNSVPMDAAPAEGNEGYVYVQIHVDAQGNVDPETVTAFATAITGSKDVLAQAAITSVIRNHVFEPAVENGVAVASDVVLPIIYSHGSITDAPPPVAYSISQR